MSWSVTLHVRPDELTPELVVANASRLSADAADRGIPNAVAAAKELMVGDGVHVVTLLETEGPTGATRIVSVTVEAAKGAPYVPPAPAVATLLDSAVPPVA